MIYDELKNLISLTRVDNTVDTFNEAVSLFDLMGQDDYMQIFEATISSSPGLSDGELVDELLVDLHVIVDNIFSMQGIKLVEDTQINDKVKMAKGLLTVFEYSDKAGIIRVLETDMNPEEKVAELISMMTDMSTEDIFSLLENVNEAVPVRMLQVINEEAEQFMETSYNELMKSIVDLYMQFKEKLLEKKPFYTDKFIIEVNTIGLGYNTYLEDLLKDQQFTDLLSEMEKLGKINESDVYHDVSLYLIAIAILSPEGQANIIGAIREHMHLLTTNINALSRLESYISKNLIKLTSTGVINE